MKKIMLKFLILLFFVLSVFITMGMGSQDVILSEIINPDSLKVGRDKIYVTEKAEVFIYSFEDFKFIKKFGRKGDGPGEFRISSYSQNGLNVDLQPDYILISSVGKLSKYSLNGDFLFEQKTVSFITGNLFLGINDNIVGLGNSQKSGKMCVTVNLYDKKVNHVKGLSHWDTPYQRGQGTRLFQDPRIFRVGDQKIFITRGSDLILDVFNDQGEKINTIEYKTKHNKITKSDQEEVINYFKNSPITKGYYQFMLPITFPKSYPGIRDFLVKKDKIYLFTHSKQGDQTELLVFKTDGTFLNRNFINFYNKDIVNAFPFDIIGQKLYQLRENPETEEIELKMTNIIL